MRHRSSFPNDPQLRRRWETAVGKDNLSKEPCLCANHFTDDCFIAQRVGVLQMLKRGAVPSIFPRNSEPIEDEDPLALDIKFENVPVSEMRKWRKKSVRNKEHGENRSQVNSEHAEDRAVNSTIQDLDRAKRLKPNVNSSENLSPAEKQEEEVPTLDCIQPITSTSGGYMEAFEDWIHHRTGYTKKCTDIHSKTDYIPSHNLGPTSLEELDDRTFTCSPPLTLIRPEEPSTTLNETPAGVQPDAVPLYYCIAVQKEDSTTFNCTSSHTSTRPLDSMRKLDEYMGIGRMIRSTEENSPILHSMLLGNYVEPARPLEIFPNVSSKESEFRCSPCIESCAIESEANEYVTQTKVPIISTNQNSRKNRDNLSAENAKLRQRVTDLEAKCATIKMEIRRMNRQLHFYKSKKASQHVVERQVRKVLRGFLSKNQLDLLLNKTKKVWWTSEEIATALTIRHMSERCYIFFRDSLHYPLPALSSLRKWASEYDMRKDILEKK